MKKWLLLIVSLLLFAAMAEAGCGTCDAPKDAKKEAVCEVKGTCKAEAAPEKAACEIKAAKKKAACKIKAKQDKAVADIEAVKTCGPDCKKPCCAPKKACGADCKKPCCAAKEVKDNASEQAQQVRKKWWKFWGE